MIEISKSQKMQVSQNTIKSESDPNKTYTLYFISKTVSDIPYEIVCNCPGYKFSGKCVHVKKYDPSVSDLYKNGSKYNYENVDQVKITTKDIQSDTNVDQQYKLQYLFWNNEEKPREMICSCKGYFYRGYCKHIKNYNPYKNDLYKTSQLLAL